MPAPPYPRLIIAFVVGMVAGCASAPTVGVRTGFENRTVARVSIAPISATSRFGTPPARWRLLESQALQQITTEMERMGYSVVDPEALRDELERQGAWGRFSELLDFSEGLDNRFEPSLYAPATSEVLTLRELAGEEILSAPAILFTEIVYHSVGNCTVDSREHSRFAIVVDRLGHEIEADGDSPCVVTHIQAKLVDAKTASTMWHNRVLRELRAPDVGNTDATANISATANALVSGAHGLAPFAPNPSGNAAIASGN